MGAGYGGLKKGVSGASEGGDERHPEKKKLGLGRNLTFKKRKGNPRKYQKKKGAGYRHSLQKGQSPYIKLKGRERRQNQRKKMGGRLCTAEELRHQQRTRHRRGQP